MHHDRRSDSGGIQDGRFQRAAGGSAGRHPRRRRTEDLGRKRRRYYHRGRTDRRGSESRRGSRHGGEPANFLDVGGGANAEQVTEAFRILLSDANVKAVLVNIFGGIMQCTTIAEAILEAYKTVGFNVPLVVRLEGTRVDEGRKILAESGVDIIAADGLTDAARKVVAAAGTAA